MAAQVYKARIVRIVRIYPVPHDEEVGSSAQDWQIPHLGETDGPSLA